MREITYHAKRSAAYLYLTVCLLSLPYYLIGQIGSAIAYPYSEFPASDSALLASYPFLQLDSAHMRYADRLSSFFEKLKQLERGEINRLRVIHIGDSHIQADFMTGHLRRRLQQRFGSAGRGLVFPFQLAQTNSPDDIRSGSNHSWAYRRRAQQRPDLPIGIAGLTIETNESPLWLDVALRPDTVLDNSFDLIRFFTQAGPGYMDWQVGTFREADKVERPAPVRRYHRVRSGDTLYDLARRYGTSVRRIQQWNGLRGSMIRPGQRLIVGVTSGVTPANDPQLFHAPQLLSRQKEEDVAIYDSITLDTAVHRFAIYGEGRPASTRIYGLSLEKSSKPGILYHAIGVNGVTYQYYNRAPVFWEQLPALSPDLIIVSLGANETASTSFSADEFRGEVERFLQSLAEHCPEAPVILSSPADALRSRRYDNPSVGLAREVLHNAAQSHDHAFWDLYQLMGGAGSIRQWRKAGLAAYDLLHFQRIGYRLQGELLYRALMHAYAGN